MSNTAAEKATQTFTFQPMGLVSIPRINKARAIGTDTAVSVPQSVQVTFNEWLSKSDSTVIIGNTADGNILDVYMIPDGDTMIEGAKYTRDMLGESIAQAIRNALRNDARFTLWEPLTDTHKLNPKGAIKVFYCGDNAINALWTGTKERDQNVADYKEVGTDLRSLDHHVVLTGTKREGKPRQRRK
jgi:hypothetical protein